MLKECSSKCDFNKFLHHSLSTYLLHEQPQIFAFLQHYCFRMLCINIMAFQKQKKWLKLSWPVNMV